MVMLRAEWEARVGSQCLTKGHGNGIQILVQMGSNSCSLAHGH